MKKKWSKFDKFEKICLLLFLSALITMIIGLTLIGLSKHGFMTLRALGVGGLLQITRDIDNFYLEGSNLNLLRSGAILSEIITPILFGLSVLSLTYHIYIIKIKRK